RHAVSVPRAGARGTHDEDPHAGPRFYCKRRRPTPLARDGQCVREPKELGAPRKRPERRRRRAADRVAPRRARAHARARGGAQRRAADGPSAADRQPASRGALAGHVRIPRGTFRLGARPALPFIFANEKWAHPVELEPFAIARAAVTNAAFAPFVEDGGYRRRELWSDAGWAWRCTVDAEHP